MAITKRIIILEHVSNAPIMFRYAMWADVPSTRQAFYAAQQAGAVSAWKDAAAGDNTALQNGSVTETVRSATFAAGTTIGQIETALAAEWTVWNATIQAANPWDRYGSVMDASNVWALSGVA